MGWRKIILYVLGFLKILFIYLAVQGLSRGMWDLQDPFSFRQAESFFYFSCDMQDLLAVVCAV